MRVVRSIGSGYRCAQRAGQARIGEGLAELQGKEFDVSRLATFRSLKRIFGVMAAPVAFAALACGQALGAPNALVQSIATTGPAPFAIHVHALNSTLGLGNELTALYEWDFGDPSGQFNTLIGWNAAHVYNQPGTYTLRLRLTNQLGEVSTRLVPVTITTANRTNIYVSPTGSDSNSGQSASSPIQTFAKAATLVGPNKAILFQRGGTFNTTATMWISQTNVLVG